MNKQQQRILVKLEKKRRECSNSFYAFLKFFWNVIIEDKYIDNWHIKYLCDELQYLSTYIIEDKIKPHDVIINIPPGSSKSTIVTIMFPVWMWVKKASTVILTSSYSASLSIDHSIKSRNLVTSEKFQMLFGYLGIELRKDKNNKTNWANNYNGERIVTSTGGTATGRHAHLILIDDPLNPEQAVSEADRKSANRFINTTLSSRKKDKEKTITIIIMQRLHENDPTGNWLSKGKNVKHICLPAEESNNIKPPELKKHYKNSLLDVNRLNRNVLSEARIDLGSYGYAGQYEQRPAPEEGGKIKKEWFEIVNKTAISEYAVLDVWIDGAYTKKTSNDPTGIDIFHYDKKNQILYWIFSFDKHLEMPELLKYISELQNTFNIKRSSRIYIEPKASGKSLKQLLKKLTSLNVIETKSHLVNEGKEAAVNATSPTMEAEKIKLIKGNWNEHVLTQLSTFPNAEHDEHVDNLCYAIDRYFVKKKSDWSYD